MNELEIVSTLKEISKQCIDGFTEPQVEQLITRLLQTLGYGLNDYSAKAKTDTGTGKPDYTILKKPPIPIEVKGTENQLGIAEIQQIKRYSDELNADVSVLTNGLVFKFYSPFWRHGTFENRVIFSFTLAELSNDEIADKLISLLHKEINAKQLVTTIEDMQQRIETKEVQIAGIEDDLKKACHDSKELEIKIPGIQHMTSMNADHLAPSVKLLVDKYRQLQRDIERLQNQLTTNRKATIHLSNIQGAGRNAYHDIKTQGDFSMGVSFEAINIKALKDGHQIVICETSRKSNSKIFLVEGAKDYDNYEPSEIGRAYLNKPIINDHTKHIASLDYIIVPGKSKDFWQTLYEEHEFDLWVIEKGPLPPRVRSCTRCVTYLTLDWKCSRIRCPMFSLYPTFSHSAFRSNRLATS